MFPLHLVGSRVHLEGSIAHLLLASIAARELQGSPADCLVKWHSFYVSSTLSFFGRKPNGVPHGLYKFSRMESSQSWRLGSWTQDQIFKSTEICSIGKSFILSHFSGLQIMIYVTEKKPFCSTRFHYTVKTLFMIVSLAQSHWKRFRIVPVRGSTENTLLFFLKHEVYIDLVFLNEILPYSTKHKLLQDKMLICIEHMYKVKYGVRGSRDYCSSLVHCFKGEKPSTNLILQGNWRKNGCSRMDRIEQGI